MLRPINQAHLLLLPNYYLRSGPILFTDFGKLRAFVRIDKVSAAGAVEVALDPGDDGG